MSLHPEEHVPPRFLDEEKGDLKEGEDVQKLVLNLEGRVEGRPHLRCAMLTNFGNLRSHKPCTRFHQYLVGIGFFLNRELWGKAWKEFKKDYMKKNRHTLRCKHEVVRFNELFLKIKTLYCAKAENEEDKAYLDDQPDKSEWRKAEHEIRAVLAIWGQNRTHPKGLYYDNEAAEHIGKMSGSIGREARNDYFEKHRNQIEQIFRMVLFERDIWMAAKKYKPEPKSNRVAIKPMAIEPLPQRISKLPTGVNKYGGQLDVIFQKTGLYKAPSHRINYLEKKSWQRVMNSIVSHFDLSYIQQVEGILFIAEAYEAVARSIDIPVSELTVVEARSAKLYLTPDNFEAIVQQARNQPLPVVAIFMSGDSTTEPEVYKRKGDNSATSAGTKRQKKSHNPEGEEGDDEVDDSRADGHEADDDREISISDLIA